MSEINMKELKEAIKLLNATGEIEPKIKVVGTSHDDLIDLFTQAVEALEEAEREIPEEAILIYNSIYSESKEKETEPEPEQSLRSA